MKRINSIKISLCELISNCKIEQMERLLYELQGTSVFEKLTVNYLSEFDNKFFVEETDDEMSEIIKSGVYSRKFIEWLEEEC